jgi:hypothetical protein
MREGKKSSLGIYKKWREKIERKGKLRKIRKALQKMEK